MPKISKRKTNKKSSKDIKKKAISPEVVSPIVHPQSTLQSYLAHISKMPILSKEEEHKLTVEYYETRNPEIAKKLIQSNLRFVIKVASEYSKFNTKIMDLIQEGNIGLLKAVQEFNPYKGARLITYAVWWIRGYIQEYLIRNHSIVRLGTNKKQQKLFYLLQKEKQALEEYGRSRLLPSIASSSKASQKEAEAMEQMVFKKDVSFDDPLGEEGGSTLLDVFTNRSDSIEDKLASHEQSALLREHLKKLEKNFSEKEKAVIQKRLLGEPPATLQEIADEFSVTREAIRQTEDKLIKKLREKLIPVLKKSY